LVLAGADIDVFSSIEDSAPTNWLVDRIARFESNRESTLASSSSAAGITPSSRAPNTISAHLKRLGVGMQGPAPLRIHIEYQLNDLADQGKVLFLKDRLLPAMAAELTRQIKVRPRRSNSAIILFLVLFSDLCSYVSWEAIQKENMA
jgi:hypothetical protein